MAVAKELLISTPAMWWMVMVHETSGFRDETYCEDVIQELKRWKIKGRRR